MPPLAIEWMGNPVEIARQSDIETYIFIDRAQATAEKNES